MAPSPWLEPSGGLPAYANFAEVSLYTRRIGNGVYSVDVPRDLFTTIMERASRHAGYRAAHRQLKSYHSRDLVLEKCEGGQHEDVRVVRKRVLSWHELPGAPLYAVMYERTRVPFSAFSCGAELQDTRYVRRLSLRVHGRAKLVFDAYANPGGKTVRRIYVEVSLDPNGLSADMPDLRRTVENTVQAVLMGVRPKHKPRSCREAP
jgi:hypothetical protein